MYYCTEYRDNLSSTNLDSIAYDADENTLYVLFQNGSGFGYRGVSSAIWRDFLGAESKGHFYNSTIRGRFSGFSMSEWDFEERPKGDFAVPQANRYLVTGFVKKSAKIVAPSLDEAVKQFMRDNPNATVTEVNVSFVD